MSVLQALLLVLIANGAPVAACILLGRRGSIPLDAGIRYRDGRSLLGPSKTVNGIVASLLATTLAAVLLGLGWVAGLAVASLAMAGDLASSFVKRRLDHPPGHPAPLLDHLPESLAPLVYLRGPLDLLWWEVAAVVAAFTVIDLLLTPVGKRLSRDRAGG